MSQLKNLLNIPPEDLDYVVNAVGSNWEGLRHGRLLLTGGTGFVGKWLLATFLHANQVHDLRASIVIVSRDPISFLEKFPELKNLSNIEWVHSDVRKFELGELESCNFCIHAATDVEKMATPSNTLTTAISGTQQILRAMTPANEKYRLLLVSSGAVYGDVDSTNSPIKESWGGAPSISSPSAAYGEGKRISELLCTLAADTHPKLEISIARCFAFVGPHLPLDKHFAIGNFISDAMQKKDIKIEGDGTPLRSYLYASDLAHWLWVILFKATNKKVYNVGGNQQISIAELAIMVNRLVGSAQNISIAQEKLIDSKHSAYVPSLTQVKADLGLTPKTSLAEAIKRTASWYSKKNGH